MRKFTRRITRRNKKTSVENNKYTTNEEESYWFLRWVSMRYERNKLKKELEALKAVQWVNVHKENLQLRKTLEEIKKDYQPIKTKIHNGHNKKRVRR